MKATQLDQLIYAMLTTNTGAHMLDSGSINGRHWQKNQKKSNDDFEKDPSAYVEDWYVESLAADEKSDSLPVTVSLYHYLKKFELDDTCNEYNALPCDDWDSDIYGVSAAQQQWITDQGFEVRDSFNTYNEDCPLSQTLQGTFIKQHGSADTYVLLQVHNGCDVRGGYTDAKMLKLEGEWLPTWDVSGTIETDGTVYSVSSLYAGTTLLDEETNEPVPVNRNSKIELELILY